MTDNSAQTDPANPDDLDVFDTADFFPDGGPAFPQAFVLPAGTPTSRGGATKIDHQVIATGMDLRDWFAGQALVGAIGSGDVSANAARAAACYRMADAMLEERKK